MATVVSIRQFGLSIHRGGTKTGTVPDGLPRRTVGDIAVVPLGASCT